MTIKEHQPHEAVFQKYAVCKRCGKFFGYDPVLKKYARVPKICYECWYKPKYKLSNNRA